MQYSTVAASSMPARAASQPTARPATAVSSRIPEFDVIRGVAIVFVVFMHAYFSPWEVTPSSERFAMHFLHLFGHTAVPAFLFMSAFLLSRDSTPTFGEFATKKIQKIYLPLAFWMLAALAYRIWQEGGMSWELGKSFLLFDISGQYYFLFVLVVFMAAFYFLRDATAQQMRWLTVAAFAINLAAIVFYEVTETSDVYAYRNPAIWVFFYTFGFYAGRKWESLDELCGFLWPGLAAMACILVAYVVEGEFLNGYPVSYFGVTVFLFSCVSLAVYPALVRAVLQRGAAGLLGPFRWLSRYAFAIYLVHMPFFVGWVTNKVVSDSFLNRDYFALMLGLFVVGFSSSLLFVWAVTKAAPRAAAELLAVDR